MTKFKPRALFGTTLVLVAAGAIIAGCGDDDGDGAAVTALPASSCTDIVYKGEGSPDVLIASDLPLQGASRAQTEQMTKAIEFVLEKRGFKAGDRNVGYQSCDDATAAAGKWESAKCTANADAYVKNEAVVGVIGTFNSGCAAVVIPRLNPAGLAMISPANTKVGLTLGGAGTDPGEPDIYYPSGKRNYARVVAPDNVQGAAQALWMQTQKRTNVYLLNDKEAYGFGVATNTRNALNQLKIKVAGFEAWDPKASSYEAVANKIKATGADAVFLGGIIDNNGGKLIKDLRTVLGPNVQIFTPDGFTPTESVVEQAGAASEGVWTSVAGAPIDRLVGAGEEFTTEFGATLGGKAVEPYSAYAAQAAEVLLDAIAASDGTRQSVTDQMFKVEVTDGILGSFRINENGDTTAGAVTMYQIKGKKLTTIDVVTPDEELVKAS